MTQLHRPRSGDVVRTRRRHRLPAGPRELGLHPDHGLEHGREPPGRLPVGDGGAASAARRSSTSIPRFTRTSAMATNCVPIRAGTRHRVPRRDRQLHPRARALVPTSTSALHERAGDHRRGLPRHRGPRRALLRLGSREAASTTRPRGSTRAWRSTARPAQREDGVAAKGEQSGHGGHGGGLAARRAAGARTRRSSTRAASSSCCKKHYRRYTPELVAEVCGCRASSSSRSPRRCATTRAASAPARSATRSAGRSTRSASSTSARRRSSSCCSATSAGPGGGIIALRGHASIQGSTDIPTLYNILPGYLPMPHAETDGELRRLRRGERVADRLLGPLRAPTGSAC